MEPRRLLKQDRSCAFGDCPVLIERVNYQKQTVMMGVTETKDLLLTGGEKGLTSLPRGFGVRVPFGHLYPLQLPAFDIEDEPPDLEYRRRRAAI